jgi:hypothetical protein
MSKFWLNAFKEEETNSGLGEIISSLDPAILLSHNTFA